MDVKGSNMHFSETAGNELGQMWGEVWFCWEEVECRGVDGGFECVGEYDVFGELIIGVVLELILGDGSEGHTNVILVEFVF